MIKERAREIEREGERGREEGGGGGRRGEGKGEMKREWVGQGWTMVTLRTAWALWTKITLVSKYSSSSKYPRGSNML